MLSRLAVWVLVALQGTDARARDDEGQTLAECGLIYE
jgi:hypothetical protein